MSVSGNYQTVDNRHIPSILSNESVRLYFVLLLLAFLDVTLYKSSYKQPALHSVNYVLFT